MNKTFEQMGREAAGKDIKAAGMAANTNRPFIPVQCPFMEGSRAYKEWKAGYDSEQTIITNLALAAFSETLVRNK